MASTSTNSRFLGHVDIVRSFHLSYVHSAAISATMNPLKPPVARAAFALIRVHARSVAA